MAVAPFREDLVAVLGGKLETLPSNVRETTRVPLGTYQGLRFGIVLNPQYPPEVYLEGAITRQSGLSREHQGPRAVLNNLERLASGYASEIDRVQQDLTIAQNQLRDYQARLGNAFAHDAYLAELTNLRDQLKAGLSASSHEPNSETAPTTTELADNIKALKAANNIEAAPQRARQKHSSAEEPITARIRRRAEATHATDPSLEGDADLSSSSSQNPSGKTPMTFQERVTTRRQSSESPEI